MLTRQEAWFRAAELDDIATLEKHKEMFKRSQDSEQETALMKAVRAKALNAVAFLAPLECRCHDKWGCTALCIAAITNSVISAELLMQYEAEDSDVDGMTALMYATFYGNRDIVTLLLDIEKGCSTKHSFRLKRDDTEYMFVPGTTALIIAITVKDEGIMRLLANVEAGHSDMTQTTALMVAVQNSFTPAYSLLAAREAHIRNDHDESPLLLAIQLSDQVAIEALSPYEGEDATYAEIGTALMAAVSNNNIQAVKLLAYTLHSEYNSYGITALMLAASQGNVEICRLLAPFEAGLVSRTSERRSALMFAAEGGYSQIVDLLVDKEAGLRTTTAKTALMFAAAAGHVEACISLLPYEKCGVDKSHTSALMHAVISDHLIVVELLAQCEACLQTEAGQTALHTAVIRKKYDLIPILAEREARIYNSVHQTALMMAVINGDTKMVSMLKNYEAGMTDIDGRTALMLAAEKKSVELISLLLDECGKTDRFGRSALFIAAQNGRLGVVKALLKEARLSTQQRFRVDHTTKIYIEIGSTALIYAALYNKVELVKILAAYEAGAIDSTGHCALHYAIEAKNSDIIKILLPLEGHIPDNSGNTALMLLIQTGQSLFVPELIYYLEATGHENQITAKNTYGQNALTVSLLVGCPTSLYILFVSKYQFPFLDDKNISLLQHAEYSEDGGFLNFFVGLFAQRLSITKETISSLYNEILKVKDEYDDEELCEIVDVLLDGFLDILLSPNDWKPSETGIHGYFPSELADYFNNLIMQYEERGPSGSCCVCHVEPSLIVCFPCRHAVLCEDCFEQCRNQSVRAMNCVMCRNRVDNCMKLCEVSEHLFTRQQGQSTSSSRTPSRPKHKDSDNEEDLIEVYTSQDSTKKVEQDSLAKGEEDSTTGLLDEHQDAWPMGDDLFL